MTYFILKRQYSERIARGNQPYVWVPLKFHIVSIPVTETGWNIFIKRLHKKHGPGTYRILRTQFEREKNGWKPVIYFEITHHKQCTIIKRYTQFKAIPKKRQPFFKEHKKQHNLVNRPRIASTLNL